MPRKILYTPAEAGEFCKALRDDHGWSLAQLAEKVTEHRQAADPEARVVTRQSIHEAEAGRNLAMQVSLLEYFGYHVEDLRRITKEK